MQCGVVMMHYIRLILKAMINHRNSNDDLDFGLLRCLSCWTVSEDVSMVWECYLKGRGYFQIANFISMIFIFRFLSLREKIANILRKNVQHIFNNIKK